MSSTPAFDAPPLAAASWSRELRATVALAWPLIVTNTVEMAMNVTGTATIARVSPQALAAGTLGLALYSVPLLFGIGVIAAVAALAARARGGARAEVAPAIRRIAQQALWGVAAITAPIWVLLWNAGALLRAMGEPPEMAAAANAYVHHLQWGILPAFVYLVLRSLFAALERPRWAVLAGGAAVLVNAVLNVVFVFGWGPVPAMGLNGSGLAITLSNLFMAAALGTVALVHPVFRPLRLAHRLHRPDFGGFIAFWRLGLPIGISLVLEVGMFSAAAALIGLIDTPSLAAHAIALQVASITFMVPLGVAQAATVRVGRAAGAGDLAGVARAGWTALALGLATMLASAVVLFAAPHAVLGLFLDRGEAGAAEVEAIGVVLLALAGLFQVADGAQVVLSGMLRGLYDTRVPMLIAAMGYWGIGLPLGAWLAFGVGLRAPGIWLGLAAGLFTVAVLLLRRWRLRIAPSLPTPMRPVRA